MPVPSSIGQADSPGATRLLRPPRNGPRPRN